MSESKRKRILIVSSSLDTGGAQKMISNITTTLPDDWKVDILLNTDKNIQFPYKGNIISLNVPEPKIRTSLWYQFRVLCRRLKVLSELKRKNHYCACISLLDSANVANIISGNRYCKTVITAVVNMSESSHIVVYKFIVFPLVRLFYNLADVVIAQNTAIKDDLISHFGLKEELFTIIYNGIDGKAVEDICKVPLKEAEQNWFCRERTLVTAGRMSYAKGQWHLIRAFKRVQERIPDAKLVIFGLGELEEYLKELISDCGLKESVCMKGFDAELDKYIANSAAFVFPSMIEGMPTVLLEALACKTACLVTDFKSGAREIMDYPAKQKLEGLTKAKYGIIVPVCSGTYHKADEPLEDNEILLADGMIELLENKELREEYAEKGKERSAYFDMQNLIQEWIRIIK